MKRVLFSNQDGWEALIRADIRNYSPHFSDFDLVETDDFDIVVPLNLRAQRAVNADPDKFRGKCVVPSDACMMLCHDKLAFADFMVQQGFSEFMPKHGGLLGYPYVLKKRRSEWGVDTTVIRDADQEARHTEQLQSADYFRQECIVGTEEFAAHLVFDGERARFAKTVKYFFTEPVYVKGERVGPVATELDIAHPHLPVFTEILRRMGYEGICCIDYKERQGQLNILEINPRFGASLRLFIDDALAAYEDLARR